MQPTPNPVTSTPQVQSALLVLALSAAICHLGSCAASWLSAPDQSITFITAITVVLATLLPKMMAPLAVTAEGLAVVLMQVLQGSQGRMCRDQNWGQQMLVYLLRFVSG